MVRRSPRKRSRTGSVSSTGSNASDASSSSRSSAKVKSRSSKRSKTSKQDAAVDYPENASSAVAVVDSNHESALVVAAPPPPPPKTSTLPEPTVACVGHGASVTSLDFCSITNRLCSSSVDKSVLIWDLDDNSVKNSLELSGHKNAILQCCWGFDGEVVYTASADKTVGIWDAYTGKRVRKLLGHTSHVNAVCAGGKTSSASILGHQTFLSCGNDSSIYIWDLRTYKCVQRLQHSYQLTSLAVGTGGRLFSAGIDENVNEWDVRNLSVVRTYESHRDTITSLSMSPDDSYLLSNSMDGQLIAWDINDLTSQTKDNVISTPYKTFLGSIPNVQEQSLIRCSWAPDGTKVCAGSYDTCSFVWSFETCDLLNRLAGHKGCVNDVVFCGNDILASGADDAIVILGEF